MDNQNVVTKEDSLPKDLIKEALPDSPTVLEVGENKKDKKEEKAPVSSKTITPKDYSWLRKNKYESIRENFSTIYILQHKKHSDKIVELRAASPVHACKLIHWKPNQVRLLGTRSGKDDIVESMNKNLAGSLTGTSMI